jgi:predicted transcriptional regulator
MDKKNNIIVINPLKDIDKLKALVSEQRIQLLDLLRKRTFTAKLPPMPAHKGALPA